MGYISVSPEGCSRKNITLLWNGIPEDGEYLSTLSASVYFCGSPDWELRYVGKDPTNVWIPPKDFRKMFKQAGAILSRLKEKAKKALVQQRQAVSF